MARKSNRPKRDFQSGVAAYHRNSSMPRKSNANDATERKREVDNLNDVPIYTVNHRNFTLSRKSNVRTSKTIYKWRYLPQEIVFEILLHHPAQVIHNVMRRVCNEWKLMISTKAFIYSHLWNSTPGVIMRVLDRGSNGIYVEMRRGHLEICKFDFMHSYCWESSLDGLVLAIDRNTKEKESLFIINPLTKQQEAIPHEFLEVETATLAIDEGSMKYKVVCAICDDEDRYSISVLTIGVDNDWRSIDIKHISELGLQGFEVIPFATRGYVHWMGYDSVLTLNVETEIIYEFPGLERLFSCVPLDMGSNPSCCLFSTPPESDEYMIEVVQMNSETGEWTKLLSSDLKPLSDIFKGSEIEPPFGVLGGGEVFLFDCEKLCVAYNIQTREIQSFELEKKSIRYASDSHVNSMVWYK